MSKCTKCNKEIPEGMHFCPYCMQKNTDTETETADKPVKNNKKLYLMILGICIAVAVAAVICVLIITNNKGKNKSTGTDVTKTENSTGAPEKEDNTDVSETETDTINSETEKETESAGNESSKDGNGVLLNADMTPEQQMVDVFYNSGGWASLSSDALILLAENSPGIPICTTPGIIYVANSKIINVEGDNFEALIYLAKSEDSDKPILLKGKKPETISINDCNFQCFRGILSGTQMVEVDGSSYYVPVIENVVIGEENNHIYSLSEIRKISKTIFGEDITVKTPTYQEVEERVQYGYSFVDHYYIIELENQSNANFKAFDIFDDYGAITYDPIINDSVEKITMNRKICVSPDLQYYIVFDYSPNDKYIILNVYDRNYNKKWKKEIENVSSITWDASTTQLAFVSDNDLYVMDLETGEEVIPPVLVAGKTSVTIVDNGYILGGNTSDDIVIFVDSSGEIINKFDVDDFGFEIEYSSTEVLEISNGNYIMRFIAAGRNEGVNCWIIFDSEGNKVKSFNTPLVAYTSV